jgi:hypothetical protein
MDFLAKLRYVVKKKFPIILQSTGQRTALIALHNLSILSCVIPATLILPEPTI